MQIVFHGAAGEVTGSLHEIRTDRLRVLLDCGAFQGAAADVDGRNRSTVEAVDDIDGVILSHGHLDHCGRLPQLYRAGFRGPVFCTPATADVAATMLEDAARIAAERAFGEHRETRGESTAVAPPRTDDDNADPASQESPPQALSRSMPELPFVPQPVAPPFSLDDVRGVEELFAPLPPGEWHAAGSDLRIRFSRAGHILGAAVCELLVRDRGDDCRLVYSGDLGRRGMPLLPDPQRVGGCDVLIVESTYADAVHPDWDVLADELAAVIRSAAERGGRIVIPAFSVGRTQVLMWLLQEAVAAGRIPRLPVFVDSPLAHRITGLYRRHAVELRPEVRQQFEQTTEAAFPDLTAVRRRADSQTLNELTEPAVIIAGGGMCEGGRIRHHLQHAIADPRNLVLLLSYQAPQTLGRSLAERRTDVWIDGRRIPLRAEVQSLPGLSAHADLFDFKWWFEGLADTGGVGRAFIVHGESTAAAAQAELLDAYCDTPPETPNVGDVAEV